MSESWDHLEPWDAPIRTAEEFIQLAERLHRRHEGRWQRVLAALKHDKVHDEAWGKLWGKEAAHAATRPAALPDSAGGAVGAGTGERAGRIPGDAT